jgi:sensor histidine kinase regulating citrate/malate metabolism
MKNKVLKCLLMVSCFVYSHFGRSEDLSPELKKQLDRQFIALAKLSVDSHIVSAVETRNKEPSKIFTTMTQDVWAKTSKIDPLIKNLTKNPISDILKSAQKNTPSLSEAFVSCADGTKVAFLSKTTSWNHKGKPKHDNPMKGLNWTGNIEVDESSGVKQIQISVPVFDKSNKPIGSIVVGYSISKLK